MWDILIQLEQYTIEYGWKQASPMYVLLLTSTAVRLWKQSILVFWFQTLPSSVWLCKVKVYSQSKQYQKLLKDVCSETFPSLPSPQGFFFLPWFNHSSRNKGYLPLSLATVDKAYETWCSHIFVKEASEEQKIPSGYAVS